MFLLPLRRAGLRDPSETKRFLPETGVLSGTTPKFQMAGAMLSQRKEAEEIVPLFLLLGLCSCSESGPSPLTVSYGLLRILLINSIVVHVGQSLVSAVDRLATGATVLGGCG